MTTAASTPQVSSLAPADTEALERSTLAALPPAHCEEHAGWLLAMDAGTVSRARSAVPLRHEPPAPALLDEIERRYRARDLTPLLRLPAVACFDGLRADLAARGYAAATPTLTQVARSSEAAGQTSAERGAIPSQEADVSLSATADEDWASVFLGEGFDPVDGSYRVSMLRRGRETVYASVRVEGTVAAVGTGCYAHGWCGVHGMRTAPAYRGRGFASRIVAALAREAVVRNVERMFLQVEQGNRAAQSIYARAGFRTAWAYAYWTEA